MVQLWRCEICGDAYIGDSAPGNCPFCGAHVRYLKLFPEASVTFDVNLAGKDKQNVEKALGLELSNAAFYFCASKKVKEIEGQKMFSILGKVESEHAAIWKKILKLRELPAVRERCSETYQENLENSHSRETRAIEFYRKAGRESQSTRVQQIFEALVEVESDHLQLSEQRIVRT